MPTFACWPSAANGFEAVKAVVELKPDLLFLDIQMPKLDGFEVLELVGRDIAVIFTTAYDNYAMRAFDAHAVDYLLKPFSADRFETALERAKQRLGEKTPDPSELAAAARPPEQYSAAHRGEGRSRRARHSGRETGLRRSPGRLRGAQERQEDIPEAADHFQPGDACSIPRVFIRIHRSHIVNLERVAKIEAYTKDSKIAVLRDGTQLPVSRAGYARLKVLLGES